jgi:hypothetical protein
MQTIDPAPDAGLPEAGATVVGMAEMKRVPAKHRAVGTPCPMERAAGMLPECPPGGIPGALAGDCMQDADCTKGATGRCYPPAIGPQRGCQGLCSYDDCVDDSGCGPSTPCECRDSATSGVANQCQTGSNCRVDADCGAGGFCSPSVVNAFCDCPDPMLCDSSTHCYADSVEVPCACGDACGHGFFCHTPQDACLDDADCGSDETCNFDRLTRRWTCTTCWPIP